MKKSLNGNSDTEDEMGTVAWYKDKFGTWKSKKEGEGYQIWKYQARETYRHWKKHRKDGPAVIGPNYEGWYCYGKKHSYDGPAIIDGNLDRIEWWIRGYQYSNLRDWLYYRKWYISKDRRCKKFTEEELFELKLRYGGI